jgi:hypothetical protein
VFKNILGEEIFPVRFHRQLDHDADGDDEDRFF